jgi:hypothetical protein
MTTGRRQVIGSSNSGLFSQFVRTSDKLLPGEENNLELIEDRVDVDLRETGCE